MLLLMLSSCAPEEVLVSLITSTDYYGGAYFALLYAAPFGLLFQRICFSLVGASAPAY